jgi:hypothetical protein
MKKLPLSKCKEFTITAGDSSPHLAIRIRLKALLGSTSDGMYQPLNNNTP